MAKPSKQQQQQPQPPTNNHLNYNVNADIKHGMEAYDLEQRELVKPIEKKVKEVKVPGRDLKEDRSKRSVSINEDLISIPSVKDNNDKGASSSSDANCFNDPFCDDKFSRDPARYAVHFIEQVE